MSIFGFLTNFLYSFLSYRIWHRLMRGHGVRMDTCGVGGFRVVTLITTIACMLFLAASGTLFPGRPFASRFISYFGNSIVGAMVAGAILFRLLAGPAYQNRLVYGREWEKQERVPVTRGA